MAEQFLHRANVVPVFKQVSRERMQAGAPITYVSRQLGHRDSAITLTVYAHWLPDTNTQKAVDRLDDFTPTVANARTKKKTRTQDEPRSPFAARIFGED